MGGYNLRVGRTQDTPDAADTKEINYRARSLYDKYGPHSGFLRYVVDTASVC